MWQFTAALLLALPAQKDNEAEKLFKDMEAKLNKAKAVSCTFEGKMEGPRNSDYKGSMVVAEGERARLEFEVNAGDRKSKMVLISDGKQTVHLVDGKAQKAENTEKGLSNLITGAVARGGFFTSMLMARPAEGKRETDPEKLFKVSAFTLGKKEKVDGKDAQLIEFKLTVEGQKESFSQQLWVDAKTGLPLKRTLSVQSGDLKATVTETYTKLTLDDKIDAKTFELPK